MPTMLTRWCTALSSRVSPLRWQHAASYTMYASVTASAFICNSASLLLACHSIGVLNQIAVGGCSRHRQPAVRSGRRPARHSGMDVRIYVRTRLYLLLWASGTPAWTCVCTKKKLTYLATGGCGGERADGARPVVDGEAGEAHGGDGVHGGDGAVAEVVGALGEQRPHQQEGGRPQHHPGRHPAHHVAAVDDVRLLHGRRRRRRRSRHSQRLPLPPLS
jgi:hypothetical protein